MCVKTFTTDRGPPTLAMSIASRQYFFCHSYDTYMMYTYVGQYCIYIYTYIYICICTQIYIYICIYIYIYIHTYIYIYIYTCICRCTCKNQINSQKDNVYPHGTTSDDPLLFKGSGLTTRQPVLIVWWWVDDYESKNKTWIRWVNSYCMILHISVSMCEKNVSWINDSHQDHMFSPRFEMNLKWIWDECKIPMNVAWHPHLMVLLLERLPGSARGHLRNFPRKRKSGQNGTRCGAIERHGEL